jgi:hypothetical protein
MGDAWAGAFGQAIQGGPVTVESLATQAVLKSAGANQRDALLRADDRQERAGHRAHAR